MRQPHNNRWGSCRDLLGFGRLGRWEIVRPRRLLVRGRPGPSTSPLGPHKERLRSWLGWSRIALVRTDRSDGFWFHSGNRWHLLIRAIFPGYAEVERTFRSLWSC